MNESFLVTGGLGYIGTHLMTELLRTNHRVVCIDDYSNIHCELSHPNLTIIESSLDKITHHLDTLREFNFFGVFHLAALKSVAESTANPIKYFHVNTSGTMSVLQVASELHIPNFVFSSTAAVYGKNSFVKILNETIECEPLSPYGASKLEAEKVIMNSNLIDTVAVLRYFNVAGVQLKSTNETKQSNIFPTLKFFIESGEIFPVFGNDYPTPDGTCIRDYIDIDDCIRAHILAMDWAAHSNGGREIFNVGSGIGFSVLEVIAAMENASRQKLKLNFTHRRSGDAHRVIADISKSLSVLNWKPTRRLDDIARSYFSLIDE
jgi:UDP-glucose 4-epimerase